MCGVLKCLIHQSSGNPTSTLTAPVDAAFADPSMASGVTTFATHSPGSEPAENEGEKA